MGTYILVISSFLFPFAIFLLLPFWGNKRGKAVLFLFMFSAFFWGVAIGSTVIFFVAKYLFVPLDFWKCYLLSISLGLMLLLIWVLFKRYWNLK